MSERILLVEDDPNFGPVLADFLRMHSLDVEWANDGKKGLELLKNQAFGLCIADVMMPEMDGYSMSQNIKKMGIQIPLIFLTAKHQREDVLEGYRAGAADYLQKPVDTEILLYKIRAMLSHKSGTNARKKEYILGKFIFHPDTRELTGQQGNTRLSPKCAALLELLAQHKNEVMNREMALLKIWEENNYFTARSMDVYINKLRKYFEPDSSIEIVNLHGKGYIFKINEGNI